MNRPRRQSPARRRWSVVSRTLAATAGGYALAALCAAAVALLSGAPRDEAVALAVLPALLLQPAAAVWAFWAATATRAWLGIAAPAALFGVIIVWIQRSAA